MSSPSDRWPPRSEPRPDPRSSPRISSAAYDLVMLASLLFFVVAAWAFQESVLEGSSLGYFAAGCAGISIAIVAPPVARLLTKSPPRVAPAAAPKMMMSDRRSGRADLSLTDLSPAERIQTQ